MGAFAILTPPLDQVLMCRIYVVISQAIWLRQMFLLEFYYLREVSTIGNLKAAEGRLQQGLLLWCVVRASNGAVLFILYS